MTPQEAIDAYYPNFELPDIAARGSFFVGAGVTLTLKEITLASAVTCSLLIRTGDGQEAKETLGSIEEEFQRTLVGLPESKLVSRETQWIPEGDDTGRFVTCFRSWFSTPLSPLQPEA